MGNYQTTKRLVPPDLKMEEGCDLKDILSRDIYQEILSIVDTEFLDPGRKREPRDILTKRSVSDG